MSISIYEKNKKKDIVGDSIRHFVTNVIERILAFIRGGVVAYFLGPNTYGIWNGLQLILEYTPYANLGLANAMDREYPYYVGKNQQQEAEEIKDTAFTAGMSATVFLSSLLILIAFLLKNKYPIVVIVGLFTMAVVSIFQQINSYYKELFRLEKKIYKVNKAILLFSSVNCILSVVLVKKFNLYGLYIALIVAYIILMIYILRGTRHHFVFKIQFKRLKQLLVLGTSLLLMNFTAIILLTVDKIMIIKFLGATSLGYYSLSTLITGFILYLPIALQFVSYPHLIEYYARTESPRGSLLKFVVKPTFVLAYPVAVIIGSALLLIDPPLKYFLPKFIPGLLAIKILTAGTFFLSLVHLPVNFLVALNQQYKVLKLQLLCILINAVLIFFAILNGAGINGVAFATTITYLIFSSLMLGYIIWQYTKDLSFLIRFFIKTYLPLVYVIGTVLILESLIFFKTETILSDLQVLVIKFLMFLIINIPFLYYWNKKKVLYAEVL